MSVEAISWALNLAPVPADRGGQPSSACKFVLVGLANHAGPDSSRAPTPNGGLPGRAVGDRLPTARAAAGPGRSRLPPVTISEDLFRRTAAAILEDRP